MNRLGIQEKMSVVFIILAAIIAAIAFIGLQGFKLSNDALGEVYERRLQPIARLADASNYLHNAMEQLTIAVIARPSAKNVLKYVARTEHSLGEIDKILLEYRAHVRTDSEAKLIKEWGEKYEDLVDTGIRPAVKSLKGEVYNDAEDTILGVAYKKFVAVHAGLDEIIAAERKAAEALHQSAQQRYELTHFAEVFVVLLGFGLCGLMAYYVRRSITRPLSQLTDTMNRLVGGDRAISIPHGHREDEIGGIAKALAIFRDTAITADRLAEESARDQAAKEAHQRAVEQHILEFQSEIVKTMALLGSASEEMRATAQNLSATAERTAQQSASATSTTEDASSRVAAVASAASEMSATIGGVERQVHASREMARQAVTEAGSTAATAHELEAATEKIADIVNLIQNIAGQTNLLALNATIEAARAGEAGRGFAVVASEVKNLADQTTKATEDVGAQIESIQAATRSVVEAVKKIGGTIDQMNAMTEDVSRLTEKQTHAVQQIASNAQMASGSTGGVLSNISGVSKAAADNGAVATQVLATAADLSERSESLRGSIDSFLRKIQAA